MMYEAVPENLQVFYRNRASYLQRSEKGLAQFTIKEISEWCYMWDKYRMKVKGGLLNGKKRLDASGNKNKK